jgi:glycosyl transferase family 25
MTLDDLSDSIYVINLTSRIDRKKNILNGLEKINCENYTLFNGVDGSKLKNKTNLPNGMFGLINTYLRLYKNWKKKKSDNILIIEDDCVFTDDFNNKMEKYIKNIPDNWDMIYFGANHNYHIGSTTDRINDYCIKLNNSYSAHCVLLKSYVFEDLIQNIKNFTIENDVMMANLQKKYNAYSSSETLTTQMVSFSNIQNQIMDYKWLIK